MAFERLKDLNINKSGSLKLKPDTTGRLAATEDLGKADVWSSEMLYRHLVKLQGHFARLMSVKGIYEYAYNNEFIRMKLPLEYGWTLFFFAPLQ
jgi:hypothetical protein